MCVSKVIDVAQHLVQKLIELEDDADKSEEWMGRMVNADSEMNDRKKAMYRKKVDKTVGEVENELVGVFRKVCAVADG